MYFNRYQTADRLKYPEFAEKPWHEKLICGCCFAFILILLILLPVLLFSDINPIVIVNPVLAGGIQISFEINNNGNSFDIFATNAFNIQSLTEADYDLLEDDFTFKDDSLKQEEF